MGIALWVVAGFTACAVTRPVAVGRTRWAGELAASIAAALALGVSATALDFGGWKEPDWRAAVFAGCGALTAVALVRLTAVTRRHVSTSTADDSAAR